MWTPCSSWCQAITLSTARAHSYAAWVVWRDDYWLDILDSVGTISRPHVTVWRAEADTDQFQGVSPYGQIRRDRLALVLLRIARRPATHAQSQTPPGRYRRHRRLRHHLRLRWAHRHPSLGQTPPILAGSVPRAAQRHPVTRLHSTPTHRAQARSVPTMLPGLD